jgi:elongation factor P--(R)-beta-lysine ligase
MAWRPSASRAVLERRATLLATARQFFAARAVLEVDTPFLVNHPVSDVHMHSARVAFTGAPTHFLHTSPEYAMKRLLAAGSGDIFQICHVVRSLERSRIHNPEFSLLEWYRIGYSLADLMAEVEALLSEIAAPLAAGASERITYQGIFQRVLALDPLSASLFELAEAATSMGFTRGATAGDVTRDDLMDFLMGAVIGPSLGHDGLVFVHGYPASQAALARLDPDDARVAQRFELYRNGVELANGYRELTSDIEQRARFESDNAQRQRRGLATFAIDEHLMAALASGLPDCAGVALGFDRLLMLITRAECIDEVIAFPTERA